MSETQDMSVVQVAPPARSGRFLLAKRMVQTAFWLAAAPRLLAYRAGRLLLGSRAFGAASESIARVPGLRGVYLRQAFYGATLTRCGHDIYFGWNSVFSMTEAELGDRVYIGRFCSIGFAQIGDEVMLADGVQILSGGHEHGEAAGEGQTRQSAPQRFQRVRIGQGAWIGAGAIVMADVGAAAIVGAGAVVVKPIEPGAVAVGIPARERNQRTSQLP